MDLVDLVTAVAEPPEPYATPPPELPAASGWRLADDALAQALVWLTRHHGRERSAASLLDGQRLDGPLGPDQALRALREAGFSAGLVQRRVAELPEAMLPALLLLNHGDACIVTARRQQANAPAIYSVVMPAEPGAPTVQATERELVAEYTGMAIVATPQAAPVPATAEVGADPAKHWLWGTLRRFVPYYRSALLAALLSNFLMLVSGVITAVVYDKVIPHQAFTTLWALASAGLLAVAFDFTARQLRAHLIDLAGKKADLLVGASLFKHSLGVRMEGRPDSAGAYAHVLAQIEVVREFFSSATLSALSDLPFILVFVAMAFVIGGPLGWVLVFAIPTILGVALLIQSALRRATAASMQSHADLHGILVEAVEGLEDIKAAAAQGRFIQAYEATTAAAAESALRARRLSAWTMNLSAVAQQTVTLVMLVWGVYLIDEKAITGGSLIGAVMFAARAIAPLTSVVALATRYQGARAAMRALDQVMAKPLERDAHRSYIPQRRLSGQIALAEVGFAYPATGHDTAPQVLKGLNLRFEPGQRVAILGRIGSGKSTVLRLLAGLYQPTAGRVEVDGIDLRQIDPTDFRAGVGFVNQEPRLFNGTLRDNVLLGRASAEPGRLAEVATLTGLARVVAGHPLGWDLPVGEAGSLLSGGQRQLVALSRCLITQPRILLMDEPTSSMDAQSEVAFLRQLKEAALGCTLVVVTHRPAVLELVERIVVVDGGRIVMDGPKAAVLAVLSGAKPAAPSGEGNVHMHPSAQTVQREAAL